MSIVFDQVEGNVLGDSIPSQSNEVRAPQSPAPSLEDLERSLERSLRLEERLKAD